MSDVGLGDLAEEIQKSNTQELSLHLAEIVSIETPTVTVRVAGSVTTHGGVDYVGYAPKVGEIVLVFKNGPNLIIWGIPGSTGGIPPGSIITFGSATPPPGYLLCNGQSTSGFEALAAVVGANVPDLRNRFIVGVGSSYAQNATGGVLEHSAVVSHTHTMLDHQHTQPSHDHAGFNHNHSVPDHSHAQVVGAEVGGPGVRSDYNNDAASSAFPQGLNTGGSGTLTTGSDGGAYRTGSGGGDNTGNDGGGGTIASPGGSVASVDNRPPYYALTYIIKT